MRLWGRRAGDTRDKASSVAQAAVAGVSRGKLLEVTMRDLRSRLHADRLGVWLGGLSESEDLRGLIWDATQDATPAEWSRLSPDSAMLRGLATREKNSPSSLDISPDSSLIGPLLEMRRALWVPVDRDGRWEGVLLAASRRQDTEFPRAEMESIAAELVLAITLEHERRRASESQADLTLVKEVLGELDGAETTGALLSRIVESCTQQAGAAFAVIGRLARPADSTPEFAWTSGELDTTAWLGTETLKRLWQEALEARRTVGDEPHGVRCGPDCTRILAIPLLAAGERQGVLMAGLRAGSASLATAERLELRAVLASAVLARWRRAAQEVQELSQARSWLEPLADALVLLDSQHRVAGLSAGTRKLLGRDPENPIGLPLADLFRGREREAIAAWSRSPLDGSENLPAEPEAELCSGVLVRLHTPIPAAGGYATVRLEAAVPETAGAPGAVAEAELLTVLEWLEQGVVLFDAQEQVRAISSRFAQIAGIDPQDVAGIRTLDALIARIAPQAADSQAMAKRWHELASLDQGAVREEIHLVRPVPRILERAARPVLDAAGRRIGWLELYRDLTAQRVFQSKILQTEKLAALGQMVTGVAHELSNPLTTILGYAQRLLLNEQTPPGEEVQRIYQEAERAARILRQLLQSGRETRPDRRLVSPNQIVLRALDAQRFGLSPETIRVEVDLDPAAPLILGDADQLQQVVMNLIGNAQQAIEQDSGHGTIRVSTRGTDERRVRLEIADDGPGIPPAVLSRIFDPFFTTKPAGMGTGLGLSIVLSIVREHGGQVQATNRPGRGAVFSVELPATRPLGPLPRVSAARSAAGPATVPAEQEAVAAGAAEPSAIRVLVVEDEPTVARLIADVLEEEGFGVDVLLDGRDALQRAAGRRYDLAICDLKMPGLDGQHFYQALARMNSPLREHVIFVTGDSLASPALEFLERNNLTYVSKPFHVEELIQAVRRAIPLRPAASAKQAAARNG